LILYVVECGVYAERYLAGVYLSAEEAKKDHAHKDDNWTEDEHGNWDNGQDMLNAVSVWAFDLIYVSEATKKEHRQGRVPPV